MSNRLALQLTQRAQTDILSASEWLDRLSADAAQRFSDRLREELNALRESLAANIDENGRMTRPPDEDASLVFSRPVFRHSFQTGKRRQRRSSAGHWYIYFAVVDDDGNQIPDTLRIYSIRHGAQAPLSVSESA